MSALRRNEDDVVRLGSGDDLRTYLNTLSGHGPQHEAVIEVDPADDLTSVRSKLESVRVPRTLLVIPSSARSLNDGVEFRVLRRLQRDLGLDIVVISEDLSRRALATENGFRNVFRTLRAYYSRSSTSPDRAESAPFSDPEQFSPALSISRWGMLIGAGFALLLAILGYLMVPMATVVVYPETQVLARDVDILVEIGGPRLDVTAQRLSGRLIEERASAEGSINVKEVAPPPPENAQPQALQPSSNVTLGVRDVLRARLLQQAASQSAAMLQDQLKSNESMPEASIRTDIQTERYDRNLGDAAESLGGTMEVVSTGLAFNNDDFNRLVESLWSQDVPRGYRTMSELTMTAPAVVSAEGQHMTLRVRATSVLQREVDADSITSLVRGSSAQDAEAKVARAGQYNQPPEVQMWPNWATRAFRVQVTTVVERPATP